MSDALEIIILGARGGFCAAAARAQAAISQRVYQQGGIRLFLGEWSVSREDGSGDAGFRGCRQGARERLASGVFNGRRVGLEVAVKNASRPDGKTTPWAYYNFTDPSDRSKVLASATAFPDEVCANCHRRHASIDNVWVRFFPTLRDRRQ